MSPTKYGHMLECSFCQSLIAEVWIKNYPKTGLVIYCEKCAIEHGVK